MRKRLHACSNCINFKLVVPPKSLREQYDDTYWCKDKESYLTLKDERCLKFEEEIKNVKKKKKK